MKNHVHADVSKISKKCYDSLHEYKFCQCKYNWKDSTIENLGRKATASSCLQKNYPFMTKSRCKKLFTTIAILIIERICIIHINATYKTHEKVQLKQKITFNLLQNFKERT